MNKAYLQQARERAAAGSQYLAQHFKKLSKREKLFTLLAAFLIALSLSRWVYTLVDQAFAAQSQRLADLSKEMEKVSRAYSAFSSLKARREAIEARYKEVEISEGVRTLLANIIESKAGIPAGQYTIADQETSELGAGYEQAPFTIKFTITDYGRLVSFLDELVNGPKPLILTRLEIKRRLTADGSLEVAVDVKSIRKVK